MSEPENFPGVAPRKYLRKGQGTARFGMQNQPATKTAAQSPMIHLPRFTPSSSIPNSARTIDSGISNEDETRPPTNSSLPIDRSSCSPQRAQRNRQPIVEEHEEHDDDVIEAVSALPTFIPDSGASSLIEPATEQSDEALNLREAANAMLQRGRTVQTMCSVSLTPSSYTSDLSAPIGASTPIVMHSEPPYPLETPFPLETPRPPPRVAQSEAQTGISLVQLQNRLPAAPPPLPPAKPMAPQLLRNSQKENRRLQALQSEHHYDQPTFPRVNNKTTPPNTRAIRNLMIQLRDATAHVDFAEEQLRKFKKELLARYTERKKQLEDHHETARKELEEQFQQKVDTVLEDVRLEKDRMQRERRDLERDRKLLQKGEGERFRETSRMIDELKKKNENLATQNSKLRLECRSKEDKIKKRGEENEKLTKENERLKKNTTTLERTVRQMRVEREKKEREEQMFAQAAFHRKGKSTQKPYIAVEPPPKSTRGRSVSWADTPEETLDTIPETMKPVERHPGCTIYRDSLGETTRVTRTPENGFMFEYSNGDRRWATARNSVTWYQFAADGTIIIDLVHADISFIYCFKRQLELRRPNNNITLISFNRADIRTELMCHGGEGYHYAELFDRSGTMVQRDFVGADIVKKYKSGDTLSFRNCESRCVSIAKFDDFELIEPEFRMRYFEGTAIVGKLFGRKGMGERTLRWQIDPHTGQGTMEAVESMLVNGVAQKTHVFEWSGPPSF